MSFWSRRERKPTKDLIGYGKPRQLDNVPAQGALSATAPISDGKGGGQVGKGTRLGGVKGCDSIAVSGTRRVRDPEIAERCYF